MKIAARTLVLLYIGLIVVIPIAAIFIEAFSAGPGAFWNAISDDEFIAAFALTIKASAAVAVINGILGTIAAYAISKYKFPGARFLDAVVDLPFAIPTAVTGLTLALLFGPGSIVGRFFSARGIDVLYDTPAIYVAFTVVTLPFVIRAVQPLLLAIDPAEEEAAVTLGATAFQRFVSIEFPVIRPGIMAGSALAFARSLGEFGVVVFVAGSEPFQTQVAATYIFARIEHFDFHGAAAASVVALAISSFVIWVVRRTDMLAGRFH